jgi:hypothetical protein
VEADRTRTSVDERLIEADRIDPDVQVDADRDDTNGRHNRH